MHKQLYRQLGIDGVRALRRSALELRQQKAAGTLPAEEAEEAERYLAQCIPTFSVDKGWLPALQDFCRGILEDRPTDHASPQDALAASRIAAAAVESRAQGGQLIRL